MDDRLICSADRENRTITFHVRAGFGDGKDAAGLQLADPETQERDEAIRIFSDAIDIITEKTHSDVPIERWVRMRFAGFNVYGTRST